MSEIYLIGSENFEKVFRLKLEASICIVCINMKRREKIKITCSTHILKSRVGEYKIFKKFVKEGP